MIKIIRKWTLKHVLGELKVLNLKCENVWETIDISIVSQGIKISEELLGSN